MNTYSSFTKFNHFLTITASNKSMWTMKTRVPAVDEETTGLHEIRQYDKHAAASAEYGWSHLFGFRAFIFPIWKQRRPSLTCKGAPESLLFFFLFILFLFLKRTKQFLHCICLSFSFPSECFHTTGENVQPDKETFLIVTISSAQADTHWETHKLCALTIKIWLTFTSQV